MCIYPHVYTCIIYTYITIYCLPGCTVLFRSLYHCAIKSIVACPYCTRKQDQTVHCASESVFFLTMPWTSFHVYECRTNVLQFTAAKYPFVKWCDYWLHQFPRAGFEIPTLMLAQTFLFLLWLFLSAAFRPHGVKVTVFCFLNRNLVSIGKADACWQESRGFLWDASAWTRQPSLLRLYRSQCLFLCGSSSCIRLSGDGVWRLMVSTVRTKKRGKTWKAIPSDVPKGHNVILPLTLWKWLNLYETHFPCLEDWGNYHRSRLPGLLWGLK